VSMKEFESQPVPCHVIGIMTTRVHQHLFDLQWLLGTGPVFCLQLPISRTQNNAVNN